MGVDWAPARGKRAAPPPPVRILGLEALQKGGSSLCLHPCPLRSTRTPVPLPPRRWVQGLRSARDRRGSERAPRRLCARVQVIQHQALLRTGPPSTAQVKAWKWGRKDRTKARTGVCAGPANQSSAPPAPATHPLQPRTPSRGASGPALCRPTAHLHIVASWPMKPPEIVGD